ncbi:hypothetical protein SASC598J21_022470 [Snodgrassella alvi SCGC AB-598-J21]|uniref:Uncharacterized protein n=1 Tax=Snodgrassella alvi SCGC AB-598-J21 TaxID=1385367 RepID=A0A074V3K1_9NEIS|nr:hypothetical protein SASC598J21_022470 [Snodgrassella alvi SCGC AB-598-J21]
MGILKNKCRIETLRQYKQNIANYTTKSVFAKIMLS